MTQVDAPSRVHFGVLSLPTSGTAEWPGPDGSAGLPVRQFGGVGLMVNRPGVFVRVEPTANWEATGALRIRSLNFARQFVKTLPAEEQKAFRVVVQSAPPEHNGLGVGTQLGLAIAKALAVETGHADWGAVELARRIGRGERSAIGIHGFDRGGLIVEGGKLPGEAISPLVGRFELPTDWAVVLFIPEKQGAWHGTAEQDAFARLRTATSQTDALCRIIVTGMLPALAARDLDLFGESVYEFNARVGDAFAPVQGGRYASPAVADCIARVRALGIRGVGQSSWGPTVFAIVRKEDATGLVTRMAPIPGIIASTSTGATIATADSDR